METVLIILALIIALPLLLAGLLIIGGMLAGRSGRVSARVLLAVGMRGGSDVVVEEDIAHLPEPVQRWLRRANVVGYERIRTVRLKQKGAIRQDPSQPWMPFTAEQYYSVDPPSFLWHARAEGPMGLPVIYVTDSYKNGRGRMHIKLGGLIALGKAKGPELDQGALLRFLNETMWFPTAALSPYIRWSPIDARSAKATMSYQGVTASAVVDFDEAGDVVNMTAQRYRSVGKTFSLEEWSTPITRHGEFHGLRVPTEGLGVWRLASGEFAYIRLEIADIEYNISRPY